MVWADPPTDVTCVLLTNRTLVSGWSIERPRQAMFSNAVVAACAEIDAPPRYSGGKVEGGAQWGSSMGRGATSRTTSWRGLRRVSTATAWATLVRHGIREPYMMGIKLSPSARLRSVGRARTLRYVPLREDLLPLLREAGMENPQRDAIEHVQPGDVFVVDAMGSFEAATMGDILASRIKNRGAAGIIADGCVRDSPYIKRMGIPVYTRSVTPAANTSALLPLEHNGPIQCGGVTVQAGDILLGDEEGVVVIRPPSRPRSPSTDRGTKTWRSSCARRSWKAIPSVRPIRRTSVFAPSTKPTGPSAGGSVPASAPRRQRPGAGRAG